MCRHGERRDGPLRIALISPKGPLYRHRGGVFRKSLRYQPLTLTTLAALVPPELSAGLQLVDEGIQDVPLDLEADLVGITVITGTARRAYALADHFRARGDRGAGRAACDVDPGGCRGSCGRDCGWVCGGDVAGAA